MTRNGAENQAVKMRQVKEADIRDSESGEGQIAIRSAGRPLQVSPCLIAPRRA